MSSENRSIIILVLFTSLSLAASSDEATTRTDEATTMVTTMVTASPTAPGPTDSPESICNRRNVSCGDCVEDKGCFYCWKSKSCHSYSFQILHPVPETCASLGDMSHMTCLVSEKSLWIMAGTGSGVLLVAILLLFYCFCCRKKSSTDRLIEGMAKSDARRERTRRAELDERRREREARMDQIRTKYGLKRSPFQ